MQLANVRRPTSHSTRPPFGLPFINLVAFAQVEYHRRAAGNAGR